MASGSDPALFKFVPSQQDCEHFLEAVYAGNERVIKNTLVGGIDVNAVSMKDGTTPLMIAACKGRPEIVSLLLRGGADVHQCNKDGYTALMMAAGYGNSTVVFQLLANGADVNYCNKTHENALVVAVSRGHSVVVSQLLAAGADVNHLNREGSNMLHLAATAGQDAVVAYLLAEGADINHINKDGFTPLMMAAGKGSVAVLTQLLAAGRTFKNPYALASGVNVNYANKEGNTALLLGVHQGDDEVVRELILSGANVNHINKNGLTALTVAAIQGHAKIVKILINHGADVNHQTPDGLDALMVACNKNHSRIVSLLLRADADITHRDKSGMTALMNAMSHGLDTIVFHLLLSGYYSPDHVEEAMMMMLDEQSQAIFPTLIKTCGEMLDPLVRRLLDYETTPPHRKLIILQRMCVADPKLFLPALNRQRCVSHLIELIRNPDYNNNDAVVEQSIRIIWEVLSGQQKIVAEKAINQLLDAQGTEVLWSLIDRHTKTNITLALLCVTLLCLLARAPRGQQFLKGEDNQYFFGQEIPRMLTFVKDAKATEAFKKFVRTIEHVLVVYPTMFPSLLEVSMRLSLDLLEIEIMGVLVLAMVGCLETHGDTVRTELRKLPHNNLLNSVVDLLNMAYIQTDVLGQEVSKLAMLTLQHLDRPVAEKAVKRIKRECKTYSETWLPLTIKAYPGLADMYMQLGMEPSAACLAAAMEVGNEEWVQRLREFCYHPMLDVYLDMLGCNKPCVKLVAQFRTERQEQAQAMEAELLAEESEKTPVGKKRKKRRKKPKGKGEKEDTVKGVSEEKEPPVEPAKEEVPKKSVETTVKKMPNVEGAYSRKQKRRQEEAARAKEAAEKAEAAGEDKNTEDSQEASADGEKTQTAEEKSADGEKDAEGEEGSAGPDAEKKEEKKKPNLPWLSRSKRWAQQLEDLACMDPALRRQVDALHMCTKGKDFLIAKGSDGTYVYLGIMNDGTEVAVKRIHEDNFQFMKNECELLRLAELDEEYIIKYKYFTEDETFGYLAMELCEYTLEDYVHRLAEQGELQRLAPKIISQIMKGLQTLHEQPRAILHRDLKPANVLIDVKGRVRLADFGNSRLLEERQTTLYTNTAGTRCWRAKETLDYCSEQACRKESDIQAAGMIAFFVLTGGQHPFGDLEQPFAVEVRIMQGRHDLGPIKDPVASHMLDWMLQEDYTKRPDCNQVLSHPFLWDVDKRVLFLGRVGNEAEVESREANCAVLREINLHKNKICKKDWTQVVDQDLLSEMSKQRRYNSSVGDLLRLIRNSQQHFKDLPREVRERVSDEDFLNLFPSLLPYVYDIIGKSSGTDDDWTQRRNLKMFFN
ncbi:uncharacterized protein LOC118417646 isoform X1 [Branchiostoma floridae]|uniref:Uncharacterized protein LOC118417646 isoform X1 n=1 Tax=Branchiostoma floridae TaxID=7739 RepID=A0A9J7LBW2_BRAFL|nr:uncharacterized protein LOC118417646 isoform X1 [Branchiostoma floridae]